MKMPEQIEHSMFAPCGINCMACYVHLKKKKPCSGCLSDDIDKPERCKSCAIKSCTQVKGITHCFDCDDFPCKRIKNLEKSYQKRYQVSLVENSLTVKEKGLENFFQTDRERWTCTECGGVISQHDKECSECGKKI
ncbi:MAG: DUF3795 domain-containing protein [bacterium]|nr:DUF3795 domain-containing protein [bacterium]